MTTPHDCSLSFLTERELPAAAALCTEVFSPFAAPETIRGVLRPAAAEHSVVLRIGRAIAGVYLGTVRPLQTGLPQFKTLADRPGIEGIALALAPAYRGEGLGRLLRNAFVAAAGAAGAEYVWGMALTSLGNHDDWSKRRITTARSSAMNISVEPITAGLRASLKSYAPHLAARWDAQAHPRRTSAEGLMVIQRLPNGRVIPWLYSPEAAISLPETSPGEIADLEARPARAQGLLGLDAMTEATVFPVREAADAPAP